jgi:hypothetical protein
MPYLFWRLYMSNDDDDHRPFQYTYRSGYNTIDRKTQETEVFKPKPLASLPRSKCQLVTYTSAEWLHRQMYLRALEFQKDHQLSAPYWTYYNFGRGEVGVETDPNAHGFLFCDSSKRVVGACAFRWRGNEWALQWIWLLPRAWRYNYLGPIWGTFRVMFGEFDIESPVPVELRTFLWQTSQSWMIREHK